MSDDFDSLASDLASSPERVMREIRQVVSKGSLNIKQQLVEDARGSEWFGKISLAMNYEITETGNSVESEIGPEKDKHKAASLWPIAYFGGSNGGGGTLPDPIHALEAEEPNLIAFLEALDGVILE